MPYLKIQTNESIDDASGRQLLAKASQLVAQELGKPEQYMMVSLETSVPMTFAGTGDPAAFLDLRSIGLPEPKAKDLSRALCELMAAEIGVNKDRVYINFADVQRSLWGWNGSTF